MPDRPITTIDAVMIEFGIQGMTQRIKEARRRLRDIDPRTSRDCVGTLDLNVGVLIHELTKLRAVTAAYLEQTR